jgi:hypothetical protein
MARKAAHAARSAVIENPVLTFIASTPRYDADRPATTRVLLKNTGTESLTFLGFEWHLVNPSAPDNPTSPGPLIDPLFGLNRYVNGTETAVSPGAACVIEIAMTENAPNYPPPRVEFWFAARFFPEGQTSFPLGSTTPRVKARYIFSDSKPVPSLSGAALLLLGLTVGIAGLFRRRRQAPHR